MKKQLQSLCILSVLSALLIASCGIDGSAVTTAAETETGDTVGDAVYRRNSKIEEMDY